MANPRPDFEQLILLCSGKRIAIATHTRADVDSLSSAFALSKALSNSIICTAEEMGDGAKALADRLKIATVDITTLDRSKFDGLIVADTAAYTMLPQAKGWKLLCIIDHHQRDGRDMSAELEITDSQSPSTAELIANLLPRDIIGADMAFALSVGIIADGARFKSARSATFETLGWLVPKAGVPYSELLDYAEPEPKAESKVAILTALKRLNYVYAAGYIIATSEIGSNESDSASLIAEAADVAFVAKWKDKEQETRVSARARKSVKVPLNEVMAQVSKELGGMGGGHHKAAGGACKCHTDEALKKCVEVFIKFAESS